MEQEFTLFEASVRDNVALWDPTVAEHDVTQALRDEMFASLARRQMVQE